MKSYCYSKTLACDFNFAIDKVTEALKRAGFGIITEIDVKQTFSEKLNLDFRKYKILGACSPAFAHKVLTSEDEAGTMLPCNIVVQEKEPGTIKISAVNPEASLMAIDNENVREAIREVAVILKKMIESL